MEKIAFRKVFNTNIEALRGFAAFTLLIHHLIFFSSDISTGYNIREKIWPYTPSGHSMVWYSKENEVG